jgi:hypothetical protein
MRTRIVTMVLAFGVGAVLVWPGLPASGKPISTPNLKTLTNTINHAKKLTYYAQYTAVSNGQKSTVTIAQAPPMSNFSSSDSSIINTGKATYYCSANAGSTSNSGNTGTTSNSGNTGNSGNSGSPSTTTTTSNSPEQCLSEKGANPLLGLEDVFSPTVALGALAEAKEGLVSKLLGITVSSSSASFAGQPSTCVAVTVHGKGGKYCVTKQGILSYSGSSSSDYFQLAKFSAKPPVNLFALPAGATTGTVPESGSTP